MTVYILDFDGTLTDAELEGKPFFDGWTEDAALFLGLEIESVRELARRFEAELSPHKDSFVIAGLEVAPATVDPYLRMKPLLQKICAKLRPDMPADLVQNLSVHVLYKYNYPKTDIVFRKGAYELLKALSRKQSWIVTNSSTEDVQHKIRVLNDRGMQHETMRDDFSKQPVRRMVNQVIGNAKKFVVDPGWRGIGAELKLPGLDRPVLLRRRLYCKTLEQILDTARARWKDVVVIGDIFELDLAVPLSCGARVGLLATDRTPDYEIAFLNRHPRGHVFHDIAGMRECFDI